MADDNELASTRRDFRQIAREEARAVYDELAIEDTTGQAWSLRRFMGFGLTRRQALVAVAYVAAGASAGTAALRALSEPAAADSSGQVGTAADPLTDVFADSVDAGTVKADDMVITGISAGSTTQYLDALTSDDGGGEHRTQQTDGVSTSAVDILTTPTDQFSALVSVTGDERANNNRFYELVHASRFGGPTVVNTHTNNSPAGRTYSRGANGNLELAMASGTYDVVATAMLARRDNNATS